MPDPAKYRIDILPQPQFLAAQSDPENGRYVFAYTITISNLGSEPAQLISRHWIITDGNNAVQEVRGLGVVGQQPLLQPGQRFEYTSWTRLATPRGRMKGTYFCMTDDARPFEAPIAEFELSQARALH
jgi:ApaG protein